MAEKPSPLVEALTRALIPPPPGETEKKEVYAQAGRAVIELSNAENYLALMFGLLSNPVPFKEATAMFASQGTLERKTNLVSFMVMHANRAKITSRWKEVHALLTAHRGVRNYIAHQRMRVNINPNLPEADVALMPLFYTKRGKTLRAADIKATADELEKINVKLWSLIGAISAARSS